MCISHGPCWRSSSRKTITTYFHLAWLIHRLGTVWHCMTTVRNYITIFFLGFHMILLYARSGRNLNSNARKMNRWQTNERCRTAILDTKKKKSKMKTLFRQRNQYAFVIVQCFIYYFFFASTLFPVILVQFLILVFDFNFFFLFLFFSITFHCSEIFLISILATYQTDVMFVTRSKGNTSNKTKFWLILSDYLLL